MRSGERTHEWRRGSQWVVLSRRFCDWASDSRLFAAYVERLRGTPMPDERLFVTAVLQAHPRWYHQGNWRNFWAAAPAPGDAPGDAPGQLVCQESRRSLFVGFEWCGAGPRWIETVEDAQALLGDDVLFVRKVNASTAGGARVVSWLKEGQGG